MSYQPLQIKLDAWPSVERFIRSSLEDLLFADVHAMLRLPIPNSGIPAGCNFAIAHTLLVAVAGLSTSLYRPRKSAPTGGAFVGLLAEKYPWEIDQVEQNRELSKLLYEEFRNPLFHHLGLSVERSKAGSQVVDRGYVIKLERIRGSDGNGLSEQLLEQVETSQHWPLPGYYPQTIEIREDAKILKIEKFYWGVRKMVEELATDKDLMYNANSYLSDLAPSRRC